MAARDCRLHSLSKHRRKSVSPRMYAIWSCIQVAIVSTLTARAFTRYSELRNVDKLEDYEIVTPIQTDSEGSVISERPKRHAEKQNRLYYVIPSSQGNFHLELTPKGDLLAPGFQVYIRGNISTTSVTDYRKDSECLYTGQIKSRPGTAVAVNVCGGLNGMIKTETQDYLIQSLGLSNRKNQTVPHVLLKRSADFAITRQTGLPVSVNIVGNTKQNATQSYYCGRKRRYMPRRPRQRRYWLPDEFPRPIRTRDTNHSGRKRNVETLVVVDSDMVRKHGADNVTTYVLTVFNMVATLYQDGTIGSNVSVALVGLVLLEGDEPGLSLTYNAEQSLNNFCQWQSMLRNTKGFHHDHAVLLTGRDICSWKNEPCDTLGYAPVNGMCSRYRSCTINEDTGLALAFTVAHEIGHNFGMIHDGKGTPCTDTRGSIMSPILSGLDGTFAWSSCSRRDMAKFLDSFRAYCLENEPRSIGELKFPDTLPGEVYDADMQCKLQFGTHSKLCNSYSNKRNICKALWCQKNGRECETKFLPAAEGTNCGHGKWCRKGSCINRAEFGPEPINGKWGEYGNWSSCSRSCDGGISYRERQCNNPSPSNGGQYCPGEDKMYRICSTQACSINNSNFIQDHCDVFSNKQFKGKKYEWKLYHRDLGALSRCRAYCVPDTADMHLVLSTKLTNGVKCRPDDGAVCVHGECRSLGCDGIVESDAKPDMCGICGGNNSSCRLICGNHSVVTTTPGYYAVMRIQKGARSIVLMEINESPVYFAIRNSSGHYYLSGNWNVDWPGKHRFAGTEFIYRRWRRQREMLKSRGPTEEELIWELLSKAPTSVNLSYEYVVPGNRLEHAVLPIPSQYRWILTESPCSRTCGLGIQVITAKCYSAPSRMVSDALCSNIPQPSAKQIVCNNTSCPPTWKVGPWSHCDCTRRFGYRQVSCVRSIDDILTEKLSRHHCHHLTKPGRKKKCRMEKCTRANWITGPWSKCHGDCSWGVQTRLVTCNKSSVNIRVRCDARKRPSSVRHCKNRQCQKRGRFDVGFWQSGKWSKCSTTCGTGTQSRDVRCIDGAEESYKKMFNSSGESNGILCQGNKKPSAQKICSGPPCPANDLRCRDLYSWCHLIVKHGICQRKAYIKKCCFSCKKLQYVLR